jgi:hypothetical protein
LLGDSGVSKKRGKGFYTEGHRDKEVTEKRKAKKLPERRGGGGYFEAVWV